MQDAHDEGPGQPTPEPQAYDDALGDAIVHASARETALSERSGASGLSTQAKWITVGVLFVLTGWLWLAPPAVLQPPPPLPITPALEETSVRMDMFVQASRILNFQEDVGRLPATAEEAGEPVDGVTYQALEGDRFRLTGTLGGFTHTWDSDESPDLLLGSAPEMVLQGVAHEPN